MYHDPLVDQSAVEWLPRLSQSNFSAKVIDKLFDLVCVCMKQETVDFAVLDSLKVAHVKYY